MARLAPAEPLTAISRFPEYGAEGFDTIWTTIVRTPVSAGQLVDNFLDASHFPFVHTGTFGDEKASEVVDEGIERDGWLVRTVFSTWYKNFDDPLVATGEHAAVQPQDLLKEGGASTTVYLRLFFPVTGAKLLILFVCLDGDAVGPGVGLGGEVEGQEPVGQVLEDSEVLREDAQLVVDEGLGRLGRIDVVAQEHLVQDRGLLGLGHRPGHDRVLDPRDRSTRAGGGRRTARGRCTP